MSRLVLLALGAFIAQTGEYLPIAVMPQIASQLGISQSAVGILVTIYAWIAALSAIPLVRMTIGIDRRTLYAALLFIMAAANLLAGVAPNYAVLLGARVVMAMTHGVFWAILALFGLKLAPDFARTRTLAIVFSGISLAGVAGIPLSAALGEWFGWRAAFAATAFVMVGLALLSVATLPNVASAKRSDGSSPYRSRALLRVVAVTALAVTGHFCAYTYIVPILRVGHATETIPMLLLAFGIAGAIGTMLAGWVQAKAQSLAFYSVAAIAVSLLGLYFIGSTGWIWPLLGLWGAATAALVVGLQGWAVNEAPGREDDASAFYVCAFNIGIGTGALAGGAIAGTFSLSAVPPAAGFVVGLALGLFSVDQYWKIIRSRFASGSARSAEHRRTGR